MVSERQGWTNGKPFTVTAQQCSTKWGGGDRDWKLRCYLCRTEASEGDTFRWVYMNSSTPSPGNFMVCQACDFEGIAEAVRASMEDWKKTFGDYAGWSFQAFLQLHRITKELSRIRKHRDEARLDAADVGDKFRRLYVALDRIRQAPECGCKPCRGSCESKESLAVELEERMEIAKKAIAAVQKEESHG